MVNKIFIFGIDGASLSNVGPWIKNGKLPFLKSLADKGYIGNLKSTMPPISCPAWASFGTGKNPGKYGAFSFLDKKYGSYEFTLNYDILNRVKGFWDYLNDAGYKTTLLNIPLFGAVKKLDGFYIAGDFCEKPFFYPKELEFEKDFRKKKMIGKKKMIAQWTAGTPREVIIKDVFEMLDNRLDVTEHLSRNKPWDVLVSVVQLDTLQHFGWKEEEKRLEYCKKVDMFLAKLLKDKKDCNIIVLGDHGGDELKGVFHINNWLVNNGYLILNKSKGSTALLSKYLPKEKIETALTKLNLAKIAMKVIPANIRKKWSGKNIRFGDLNIDWSKTKAFACGDCYTGSIYINKKDREPNGIIENEEKLIKEIKSKIKQLKGPNGEKLKVAVFESKDIYKGDYAKNAPDLLYMLNDMEYTTDFSFNSKGDLFSKSFKQGDHRPEGMIIAAGPDIKKASIKNVDIMDIAPTVLYLMGVPVPKDMDGRVLKEMLKTKPTVDNSTFEKKRIQDAISKIKI